jgi:hypothetical protein
MEINYKLEKETVLVSSNLFERHPESYSPPVIVAVSPDPETVPIYYELLKTGEAIPWTAPPTITAWVVKVRSLSDLTLIRK